MVRSNSRRCVSYFCISYFGFVFLILDNWEEARKYLTQAKKGTFQGVDQQKYGRGKREPVPKKIYTPPSVNGRGKKIAESNPPSSEDVSACFPEPPYPTPPPALQQQNMDLPVSEGKFILIIKFVVIKFQNVQTRESQFLRN